MEQRPRQLTLELLLEPSFSADDFLVAASNSQAFATLARWPHWLGRRLIIAGPAGSGKSHLAAIWAQRSGARIVRAAQLTLPDLPALALSTALVIEDADRPPMAEAALFHLLNLLEERGHFIVLTAQSPPDHWQLETPDLLSRLRLAHLVTLHPPDEALVRDVLVKLFADRQLAIDPPLVAYLARRVERSLGAARSLVDQLDKEALAQGRRITRTMASALLLDAGGEADDTADE